MDPRSCCLYSIHVHTGELHCLGSSRFPHSLRFAPAAADLRELFAGFYLSRRTTVTSTGCDGMPLAITISDDAPVSRSAGIAALVVTTKAPVATPMDVIVLPLPSSITW